MLSETPVDFVRRGLSDGTNRVLFVSPSISFDENSTSSAGELSGSTNTVLSEFPVDFV